MDLDNLVNNFFGMSFEKQIELLNEILNGMQSKKNRSYRIFKNMFEGYYKKILLLIKNKELYNKLNSNQRRILRLKSLKRLEEEVIYHSRDNYELSLQRKYIYYYGSEYFLGYYTNEFNSYFHPKKISNKDSEEYIEQLKKMSINEKYNIIKKYISQYSHFKEFFMSNIPNTKDIINDYNPIILNILGPELFAYYNKLNSDEKISIITDTAMLISDLESDNKNTKIIKDKNVIKNQKVLTLKSCKHYLKGE